MRIPKLRGFKNRFKIEYEVVNVGAIGALAERGAFERRGAGQEGRQGRRQITVNQDILRAVGLVRTLNKPLKILGAGELSVPLFVVADAFTASARTKIEAAGGVVNVLEIPTEPLAALGVDAAPAEGQARAPRPRAKAKTEGQGRVPPRVRGRTPSPTTRPTRPRAAKPAEGAARRAREGRRRRRRRASADRREPTPTAEAAAPLATTRRRPSRRPRNRPPT